jgi:tetratricopeptide (TPR) repeat protein
VSKVSNRLIYIVLPLACFIAISTSANDTPRPLGANEIAALIVGDALPENIAKEIARKGIAFRPDDGYRSQLRTMGADASILAALDAAKIEAGAEAIGKSDREAVQHYVNAVQAIKNKDYDGAGNQLTTILKTSFDDADAGFAMGEVLRLQGHFTEAAVLYEGLLKVDPNFPEANTKLAYIVYRLGDGNEALKQARAALALRPDDAEAHKNAGLALYLLEEYDAAETEYEDALAVRPDYWQVWADLGSLYDAQRKYKLAITEYKKALSDDPNDAELLDNLGIAYDHDGEIGKAMPLYRQAIKVDPKAIDPRRNLAADLDESGLDKEAVEQFRAFVQIAPDSSYCHACLGHALYRTGDSDGAEKEFDIAIKLDPANPSAYLGIGNIRENQKRYDEALAEYLIAERLDNDFVDAPRGAGRVYLLKQDYLHAESELKRAENIRPADANVHDLYAQALLGENKTDEAIAEFKESLLLDPKQSQAALRLAQAYEANGNWTESIQLYRKTAAAEASLDYRHRVVRDSDLDPQQQYEAALARFNNHIAALKAAGKTSEVATLEQSIAPPAGTTNLSDKLNLLMQAGAQASSQREFDAALKDYEEAVGVAEQLQPHDQRLITALNHLGNQNMGRDFGAADSAFEQELKVTAEIYGAQSPNLEGPLESLGTSALLQKNYHAAETYYFRAVDLDEKIYGESSDRVASSLVMATRVYMVQQQYGKAEPYLLRAENLDEAIYGADSPNIMRPLWTLCNLYDQWGKPEKAEPCYSHSLNVAEKEFGADSPELVQVLDADAAQLRKLGRNDEANKIATRAAALRASTMSAAPASRTVAPRAPSQ